MAAALARGLWLTGAPGAMRFTDSGSGRAKALAEETGGEAMPSLRALAAASDVIILAVKPKALGAAAEPLARFRGPIVSVLGATTLDDLRAALPEAALLRTMPNVGVELARGTICHAPPDDPEALAETLEMLTSIAWMVELPEAQLDAATAVMGCSPAWLTVAAQAISDEGVAAGLDQELAAKLIARTAAVTGELMLRHDPAEIRRAVASPGRQHRSRARRARRRRRRRRLHRCRSRGARPHGGQVMGLATLLTAGIDRLDVAAYVDALFTIYTIMILIWIVISWVITFRGSLPYNTPLRVVTEFIEQCVSPFLNLFRRIMPPIGAGGMNLDLSPIIAIIVLMISRAIIVGLIEG